MRLADEAADTPTNGAKPELLKGLGLLDATMIVTGSMIGSAIYIVSADIARQVSSPGLLLIVWAVAGSMTIIGALSYGELASAMPAAGGQYVYLRESLGPLWAFLYGWAMLLVIQTATIAAVAIGFAKFTGVLFPWVSSAHWIWKIGTLAQHDFWFGRVGPYSIGVSTENFVGILSIALLTWLNTRGLRIGALVQNVFTVTKLAALAGLIGLGTLLPTIAARHTNFSSFWGSASLWARHPYQVGTEGTVWIGTVTLIGVAMVGALFAADAWNNVTFTAAEVKNPRRNLPLSLALGTGTVILIYLLANIAYLNVLPFTGTPDGATVLQRGIQFAAGDRVATAAAEVLLGPRGATLMAIAIMISTFGCNNGLILAGARVYYAMANDGLFFQMVKRLNKYRVPGVALVIQGIWASVLCLSGTYSQLLDFLIFAVLIFYILTFVGLFVLRFKRPDLNRPYRAFGYPVLPIFYLAAAVFIEMQLLRYKPQYTWPGLIIVLLGVPVYWLWRGRGTSRVRRATGVGDCE